MPATITATTDPGDIPTRAGLLMILLAEINGEFKGQALCSDTQREGAWWFGPVLNFADVAEMENSASGLMSEVSAPMTYIVRLSYGEPLASTVVIRKDTEQIMVGLLDVGIVERLFREIQKSPEGGDTVFLADLLEPPTKVAAAPEEEPATTGPAFPDGTVIN